MSLNSLHYSKFPCYNQGMYLCIDIGATKTLVAVFTQRGHIIRKSKFFTSQGAASFLHSLTETIKPMTKYRMDAVVVAIPGIVHKDYSVHFGRRNWDDIDILTPIKNLFSCPIWFENDANLAAVYESEKLPGRTVFLTFSTGLGGGVAERGRLVPEYTIYEPGDELYWYGGKQQRWTCIASASAIGAAYHVDRATSLRGEPIMHDIANRISLGIPDVVSKYHPDNIVIGGPMGKLFHRLVKFLPKVDAKYVRPRRPHESVIYGCFAYARQKERDARR